MTELPEDDQYRAECDDIERDFEDAYNDWRPEVPLPPAPLAAESDESISGAQTTALSLDCGRLSAHATLLLYAIRPALLNRARDLLQAYCKLLNRYGGRLSIASKRNLLRDKMLKELNDIREHQWARIVDPLIKAHYEWGEEGTDIRSLFNDFWSGFEQEARSLENGLQPTLVLRHEAHVTTHESPAPHLEVQSSTLAWEQVEIVFLSEHRLQILQGGKRERTLNYAEFGLVDRRTDGPNKAWEALRALAEGGGRIKPGAQGDWPKLEKRIQEIRAALRKCFLIDDDPIPYSPGNGYVARFKIGLSRSFDA